MYISKAFQSYKRDKKIHGYSQNTLKAYQLQTRLFIRHFGEEKKISEITYEDLKDYIAKDYDRLKPSSVGHRVRYIRSLFRWAHDEGYLEKNPASRLKEPKEGIRIPNYMEKDDIELLKSVCKNPLEHLLIRLLYATGCRIGELHKINISDIDISERAIVVNGKGDKERIVFFNAECKIWIQTYLNSRSDGCEALFVTERKPRRSSIDQLRYVVKRVAKRTGIETSVYPHRFRYSMATHLFGKDAPLDFIQSILGHTKSETTRQIYIHANPERRKQLYDRYN